MVTYMKWLIFMVNVYVVPWILWVCIWANWPIIPKPELRGFWVEFHSVWNSCLPGDSIRDLFYPRLLQVTKNLCESVTYSPSQKGHIELPCTDPIRGSMCIKIIKHPAKSSNSQNPDMTFHYTDWIMTGSLPWLITIRPYQL